MTVIRKIICDWAPCGAQIDAVPPYFDRPDDTYRWRYSHRDGFSWDFCCYEHEVLWIETHSPHPTDGPQKEDTG